MKKYEPEKIGFFLYLLRICHIRHDLCVQSTANKIQSFELSAKNVQESFRVNLLLVA